MSYNLLILQNLLVFGCCFIMHNKRHLISRALLMTERSFHPNNIISVKKLHLQKMNNQKLYCETIEQLVYQKLKQYCVGSNPFILLCVSGGSDSMAMLHIMHSLQKLYMPQLSLQVINFNHKLRIESDEEANFVGNWANTYEMAYHTRVAEMKDNSESNFQEMARNWRRSECLKLIDKLGSKDSQETENAGNNSLCNDSHYIATAHNSEDQIETLLLKLLRGVHISNFQPMKPLDGPFLKPVLELSKKQLQDYLIAKGGSSDISCPLEWREDSSNESRQYKRNAIRLDLIPPMAEIAGGFDALSKRLMIMSQQSSELLRWIQMEIPRYKKDLLYISPPHSSSSSSEPYLIVYHQKYLLQIPSLVLREIIHQWILNHADLHLDGKVLDNILKLITSPQISTKGKNSCTISISKQWDFVSRRNRLSLKNKYEGMENSMEE